VSVSLNVAYCAAGAGEDTFKPRLANHVLHIGIDGLHPCFVNSSTGAPNIMTRIAAEGTYTLTRGRTELVTVSAPSWTAILCSLPMETSGTTSNAWRLDMFSFSSIDGRDCTSPFEIIKTRNIMA